MIPESITSLYLPYPGQEDRLVRVCVPEHEEGETFPVVYMTDGQNLFEEEGTRFGSWHTREAVAAVRERGGKAAVIVGIDNEGDPVRRTNDLLPKSIGRLFFPPDMPEAVRKTIVPAGEAFDDFVVNTLMPVVEERFPVKKGRENTAFCGSSSGGLQSFYTALSHPDLFGAAGVFSPVFMPYHPGDFAAWVQSRAGENVPFLYLYSGAADPLEAQICQSTEMAYGLLAGCCPAERLKKDIRPENPHKEAAWAEVFEEFLGTAFEQ